MSDAISSNERTLASLKKLVRGYVSLLESARERILFHGGTCDTVEQMEAGDPYLAEAKAAIALAESSVEPEAPRCEDRIFGLQCVKPQGHDGPHVIEPTDGPADTSARPAGRVRRLSVDVAYDDGTSGLLTMKPRESEGRRLLGVLRQLAFDSPPKSGGAG